MSVGPEVAKQLRGVLEDIPHVQHAFAYGSGVLLQPDLYDSSSTNKPMLDFIFAVDDPVDWHLQVFRMLHHVVCPQYTLGHVLVCLQNLQQNGHHYSFLGSLGPSAVRVCGLLLHRFCHSCSA